MNTDKLSLLFPQVTWIFGQIAICILDYMYRIIRVFLRTGSCISLQYEGFSRGLLTVFSAVLLGYATYRMLEKRKMFKNKYSFTGYVLLNVLIGFICLYIISIIYFGEIMADDAI